MSERRKEPRLDASHAICYRRVDRDGGQDAVRCRSVNVSDGGLALETAEALLDDETLAIEIVADERKAPIQAVAKVAWCRPRAGGWLVGVEFLWVGSPLAPLAPSMMGPLPWSFM